MRNGAVRPVTYPLHAVTQVRHRAVADMPAAAAGLAPGGNRRHTRYTVTLPMRNSASRPVTYPLHAVTLACAGGKPALHPLHRYITYEKRRFSTRYVTVTCRYTCLRRAETAAHPLQVPRCFHWNTEWGFELAETIGSSNPKGLYHSAQRWPDSERAHAGLSQERPQP